VSENTTVIVSKDTRDALKAIGMKGETYDAILRRLIMTYTVPDGWPVPDAIKKLHDIEKETEG